MANISNIILADGQTTPVNKTFNPMDCTSQLAVWSDRSQGIGLGQPELTLSVQKGKEVYHVKGKVSLPVMEVISGSDAGYTPAPQVAYTVVGSFDFSLPMRASLQNRKDILAFVRNYLNNAHVVSAVQDFERPY